MVLIRQSDLLATPGNIIVQELICSKEIINKINWSELEDHYTKELEFQAKTNI